MRKAEINIPAGFVLTTTFFQKMLTQIKQSPEYSSYIEDIESSEKFDTLKVYVSKLECDPELWDKLNSELNLICASSSENSSKLLAVRSSSPEEDLGDCSFAGMYATVLGVPSESVQLWTSIKEVFLSCLDRRVLEYKKLMKLDYTQPKIAVIVMAMVNAEVAGVAFSLNPQNNDYDELVINSNFGLGETVVSGTVTPDTYIIDKVDLRIIEQKLGKKEVCLFLTEHGTEEKLNYQVEQWTLSDKHIEKLAAGMQTLFKYYKFPVDVEWAFENNTFVVLQARPITTAFNIPESIQTIPGEPRHLYYDIIRGVQGHDLPISKIAVSYIRETFRLLLKKINPKIIGNVLHLLNEGKIFANLSTLMYKMGQDEFCAKFANMDSSSSSICKTLDLEASKFKDDSDCLTTSILSLFWNLPALKIYFSDYKFVKNKILADFTSEEVKFRDQVKDLSKSEFKNLFKNFKKAQEKFSEFMIKYNVPMLYLGVFSGEIGIKNLFEPLFEKYPELHAAMTKINQSLPHNITLEMGMQLYQLSRYFVDCPSIQSVEEHHAKLLKEDTKYLEQYNSYLERFGFRSENEFDFAIENNMSENPQVYNKMILNMSKVEDTNSPIKIFENGTKSRMDTHEYLTKIAEENNFKEEYLSHYEDLVIFRGYREEHKYNILYTAFHFKPLIKQFGQILADAKVFTNYKEVYDFTLEDLEYLQDVVNKNINNLKGRNELLRTMVKNMRDHQKGDICKDYSRVPLLFDSRGRYYIQKRRTGETDENEIIGYGTSYGVAKGQVTTMRDPMEKPFNGGILVAVSTNPGWTPVIIKASALILQTGGSLQHGALLARELGIPCVVGIMNVFDEFHDGQEVEVDAANDLVRKC